jgi:hypothetical protein
MWRKYDPKLIAAARELRDRWLEEVQANPSLLLPRGKYDVARHLTELDVATNVTIPIAPPLLDAA